MGRSTETIYSGLAVHLKNSVLAFSGVIASGKTTISLETSKKLGWKYGSFGDFIRKEAIRRGADHQSRKALQIIGEELINRGWVHFCWAVIKDSKWETDDGLVLDGIRHIEGLETLRDIFTPLPVYLIYVQVSEEIRINRLKEKKLTIEEIREIEQHSTEIQVEERLLKIANLKIDGHQQLDDSVNIILEWLKHKP